MKESDSRSAQNQRGSARTTVTAEPSSPDTTPESRSCPTCGRSTLDSAPSTCSTPGTHASRSRPPGSNSGTLTPGISGPQSLTPFAYWSHDESCWKTSRPTFVSDSFPSSETLPPWGSLHDGALYEHPTWVPPTREHDSSSSLMPTPVAMDSAGIMTPEERAEYGHGSYLRDLMHLLPTPMANQENPGAGGELRAAITHGPSRRNETGIDTWGRPNNGRTGEPTNPPSDDGSASSDDPPPDQLMIWGG